MTTMVFVMDKKTGMFDRVLAAGRYFNLSSCRLRNVKNKQTLISVAPTNMRF